MKKHNVSGASSAALGSLAAGAATALWNIKTANRAERHTPPIGRFIEVDGVKLHYVRRGRGSPIVLIHGNGSLLQDWAISGVQAELERHHEVIAFDRPGFGHSARPRTSIWTPAAQAKLIATAMERSGINKATVVGHSFGALVAVQLALDYPSQVGKLVLLSGYYFPSLRVDAALNAPPASPLLGDILRFTISPALARATTKPAFRKIFAPAPVTAQWESQFPKEMAYRPSQIRAVSADGALMVPGAWELKDRYSELQMPLTIVAGEGDLIADPEAQSRRLHLAVQHSRFEMIPGAGHMVHHTEPARAAAAILG